jgi:hypothetical protein
MGLRREDVYGVHIWVGLPSLLDALDIWLVFSAGRPLLGGTRDPTGDIVVENVIFVDGTVDELPAGLV